MQPHLEGVEMTKQRVLALVAFTIAVLALVVAIWSLRKTRQTLGDMEERVGSMKVIGGGGGTQMVSIGVQYVCLRGGVTFVAIGEAATFEDAQCAKGSQPFKYKVDGRKGKPIYNEQHKDPSVR